MLRVNVFLVLIVAFLGNTMEKGNFIEFDYFEAANGQRFYPDNGESAVLVSSEGYGFPNIEYRSQRGVNSDRAVVTGRVVQKRVLTWLYRDQRVSNKDKWGEGFRLSELLRPDRVTQGSRVTKGKIFKTFGDGRSVYIEVLLQSANFFGDGQSDFWEDTTVSGTIEFLADDPFFYDGHKAFLPLVVRSPETTTLGNIFYQPACAVDVMAGGFDYITGSGTAYIDEIVVTKNNIIYAAGAFSEASNNGADDPIQAVARWNETANLWEPLGTGATGSTADFITAMAYRGDGKIFVAGDFDSIGGVTASNIAVYDIGSDSWSNVGGTGATVGIIQSLTIGLNGEVYATGSVTQIAGVAVSGVAVFESGSWSAMGSLSSPGTPIGFDIEVDNNGNVYVGGFFNSADGNLGTKNLAVWKVGDSQWTALGGGTSGTVNSVHWHKGYLYVGGLFEYAYQGPVITPGYSLTVNNITRWNGSSFLTMAGGTVSSTAGSSVEVITHDNEDRIWAGGFFGGFGDGTVSDRMGVWTPNAWQPTPYQLTPPTSGTPNSSINAISFTSDGIPVFGGRFSGVYGVGCTDVESTSSAQSYLSIAVSGPGTLIALQNFTNKTKIYFNSLSLFDYETVTVDMSREPHRDSNGRLTTAVTIVSDIKGNVYSSRAVGSDTNTFTLEPGVNEIGVFIQYNNLVSPVPTASLTWRGRYWTVAKNWVS